MLLNVFFHYDVTAESYLHYNKGIFYRPPPKKKMGHANSCHGNQKLGNWETEQCSHRAEGKERLRYQTDFKNHTKANVKRR